MLGVSMRLPEAADIGMALNAFIAGNYTPDELRLSGKGLSDIQQLRNRMVASVARNATEQDHANTLSIFTAYYKVLSCVIARFPFQSASAIPQSSGGGLFSKLLGNKKVTQVKFSTSWFDAFRHSQRVNDIEIGFEKYSVLFNIGSLLSRQATQIKSAVAGDALQATAAAGSDSSLKEACRLFQLSSGVFDYLSKTSEVLNGTIGCGMSLDLNVDTLSMLSVLMLAQAQACMFEKATTTASPTLVAKLAMGVSTLFQDAHVRCEKNGKLKAVAMKSDVYPWGAHAAYQQLCYAAASHYWHAKGELAADNYGAEIGHLERARLILFAAKKHENGLLKNLSDNRNRLEAAINARLLVANKDNETIYYASVPRPEQIPNPDPVTPVKPLSYFDVPEGLTIDPAKDDPFIHLISPFLREQFDTLRVKIGEVQTVLVKKVNDSEVASKAALDLLGLPASLDALNDSASGLPDDLWRNIQDVQYKGGVAQLNELSDRINAAVTECKNAFHATTAQMQKEAELDGGLRKQFAHRWNRRPSEQLTVNFQRDATSIQRFLDDADTSNRKVRQELDSCQEKFALLMSTHDELDKKLPRATAEQSTNCQQAVSELRMLLTSLAENTAAQKALLTQYEAKLVQTDLMSSLVAASTSHSSDNTDVITQQLVQFQEFHTRQAELETKQTDLLANITQANQTFLSHRSQDDSTKRRQLFLQELNTAIGSYSKLLANFSEGLKFYSDLQLTKISPFTQRVGDFVIARDMESKLILEQLTKEIAQFKEDEVKQDSVYGNGAAAGMYSGAPAMGASSSRPVLAASNPNLAFEPSSHLYNLQSPTGAAANAPPGGYQAPPAVAQPPVAQPVKSPQPQPQQPSFQVHQAPPPVAQQRPAQPPVQQQPQYHPPPQQQQPQYNPYQQPQQSNPYQQAQYGAFSQPHQQPQAQPYHQQPPPQVQHNPYQQGGYAQQAAYQPYHPPPQQAPSQPQGWACAQCTFINTSQHAPVCGMCGATR